MFEKFSNLEIDSAGRGGEYTVQAGFGWTNGVALWITQTYGHTLGTPQCPNIVAENGQGGVNSGQGNVNAALGVGAGRVPATAVAILSIIVSLRVMA